MNTRMKNSGVEWIGDIPENWEISKIKFVADFQPACDLSKLTEESVVTYTPMENIKSGFFIDRTEQYGALSKSLTAYQEGDIVFAKVTPCFENDNIAIMDNLASGYGFGSSELFVIRPKSINTRYLFYWLRNDFFKKRGCATMTGTGGLKRVSPYFVENCEIHIPPQETQQKIVSFLDVQCAELDAVLEKTRQTVEEYKKLKQAVITQAVTRGVRGKRTMKDSGIQWIGEIPAEWKKDKVIRLFSIIGSGTTPKSNNEDNFEGSINWIQSGDINGGDLITVKNHVSEEALNNCSALKIYEAPFIVIAMYGASIGNISISKINGCVNQACCVLKGGNVNFKYGFYVLKSVQRYLIQQADGGGQPNISQEKIKSLWIPIPPSDEQAEIAVFLDRQCAEIDALIAKKEQYRSEIETYKKSLIYEVVTGKREVA